MRVRWTPEAEQDRSDIWDCIATDNPVAAVRIDRLFSDSCGKLADFPMLGHDGKIPETRELRPHESYRLIYEIEENENTAWVLALVHTARLWPPVAE